MTASARGFDEVETRRRRKLIVAFAILAGTVFAVVAAVALARGGIPGAVIGVACASLCFSLVPLLRIVRQQFVAHLFIVVFASVLTLAMFMRGGLGSPPMMALGLTPTVALLLVGRRTAITWTAIVVAVLGGTVVLQLRGIIAGDMIARFRPSQLLTANAFAGALFVVFLTLIGLEYERRKDEALAAITKRDEELREAEQARGRAETQARVARAEHLASLGQLAAGAAHEINNPLACVLANLGGVERAARLGDAYDADARDALQDALLGAKHIQRIVRDLKTYSRADLEVLEPVDVHTVIANVLKMLANETRHRANVICDLAEPYVVAVADEGRLGQIVLNLVLNAAQAIPEGRARDNAITIRTRQHDESVVLEVEDTGVGIPEELMSKVTQPFFTTKPVGIGTGLGLSACANLAKRMQGRLELESTVGEGTCARVVLRATDERPAPRISTAGQPEVSGRARILIVDDDPMVARALKRLLREHELVLADHGAAARRLLAEDAEFDLVLSDLMMPEMTGMELFAYIQRAHPELEERFIVTSGGAFSQLARDFLERFDGPVLEKPFSEVKLATLVANALERDDSVSSRPA